MKPPPTSAIGASAGSRLPDLILLDLKLPKVSGLEVLQKIRSDDRTRGLPIVVRTPSDEEKDIVESYSLGANSYIRKPVDFDEFIDAVKQIKSMGISLLIAESNLMTATRIADRLYAIDRGEIIYEGTPKAVLKDEAVVKTIRG